MWQPGIIPLVLHFSILSKGSMRAFLRICYFTKQVIRKQSPNSGINII